MKPKIVGIVQARMGSKRLPGKVLMEAGGKTLLEWHLSRVSRAKSLDQVILATPDENLARIATERGIEAYIGSEDDVLERYFLAAKSVDADIIVRTTADNPLIDPGIIDDIVTNFMDSWPLVDIDENIEVNPAGFSVEVFSASLLAKAHWGAQTRYDREHVCPWMYRSCGAAPRRTRDRRFTVDTKEDFERVKGLLEVLPVNFTMEDCLELG